MLLAAGSLLGATPARAQDLTISSFTASVVGTTATFSITVCNTGAAITSSFFIDLYYNRTTAPSCSGAYDDFVTINSLASGACTTRTLTRTATPPGSYTAWVLADGDCQITESNENNNTASAGYTVSSIADLRISSFTTSVNGTTVTYNVTVCNDGGTAATNFYLDLYYNRATAPTTCYDYGDDSAAISTLNAGACTNRTFTRTGTPTGSYIGWARVDADCVITETNENNNNASSPYSVGLPDLVVQSLAASVSGTTVTFNVTICNNGGAAATNFDLDLYYDRATAPACPTYGDDFVTITTLAAGACVNRTFSRTSTPTGTYTAWARVDSGCDISESNETNNNASASYTVSPLPDLAISSFSASVSGGTVIYTITVCNNGGATAPTFDLDLYFDRATAPSGCPVYGDEFWTITNLAAGTCTTRTHTRTGTPAGSYMGWARADSGCDVTESNENNNNASAAYTVSSQPDLTITAFTATVNGGDVTYSVTVCNQGGGAASNIDLELYYNLASAPTCSSAHDQQASITSLAAGACTTRLFTRTGSPSGTFTARARVDADCSITESNENNNNAAAAYTVQPELTIQSFTTSVAGGTVTFSVTVCNQGGGTTTSFDLDVYYNRSSAPACPTLGDGYATIAGLAAGACTTRTFTRTATPVGSYNGWARVDSTCAVTESNENNNNASSTYTVAAQADLVVQSFTATVTGTTVTFNVNVCNNGGSAASSITLELYYDRTSAPGCTTTHDQTYTFASLAAGACATHSFTRTATPSGAYTGWARADADCAITESDENNNNASASYTVGSQPDLTVQTFTATVSGTTVTFNVTICNQGGATTASFDLDIYYNLASAPACPTYGTLYATIAGGLGAGACTTKTFTRTSTPAGVYTGWARVDSGCEVTESNENNNNASAAYTVNAAVADAGVPDAAREAGPKPDQGAKTDTGVKLDTGVKADTGVKTDSQLTPDQGIKPDSSLPPDQGQRADAGVTPDSGAPTDDSSVVTGDRGAKRDTETPARPEGGGGCNCELAGDTELAPLGLLFLLGLVLFRRRRR
jgi:MYXO-CTERM domain-containing protein